MVLHRLVVAVACVATLIVVPAGGADQPDEDLPGRLVVVKPPRNLLKFISRTDTDLPLPLFFSDPRGGGGTLVIRDAGSSQVEGYTLPASGWKAFGDPPQGFRYKGTGSPSDPCRMIIVRKRLLKAVCQGTGVTLTTPFVGDVQIGLTVGYDYDSKRYCARFGGAEARNDDALLRRSDAPAMAASCPTPLPTTTTSTLPFECASQATPCGTCGHPVSSPGFCAGHVDPDPPANVCTDSSDCSAGTCTNDGDCPSGQLCVQNPFPPGNVLCCSPCP